LCIHVQQKYKKLELKNTKNHLYKNK